MNIKKLIEEEIENVLKENYGATIKAPPANSSNRVSNANKVKNIEERPESSHEEYEPELSSPMQKTQRAKKKAEIGDKKISGVPSEKIYEP